MSASQNILPTLANVFCAVAPCHHLERFFGLYTNSIFLVVIGFCAETEDLESHAFNKLKAKRLDWIAGNLVGKASVGFQSESNELLVLNARGGRHVLGPGPKLEVAQALVHLIGLES